MLKNLPFGILQNAKILNEKSPHRHCILRIWLFKNTGGKISI